MSDLLAIEWQGKQLAALEGAVSRGSVRVRTGFVAVPPEGLDVDDEPARAGEWLAGELRKHDMGSKQVVVVLPREDAVLRRIDLPDVSDDELPDLVSMQAATVMSTPLDRMLIDFVPLPRTEGSTTRSVLLATVVRERVDALRAALNAAGREMAHIRLAPAATSELVGRLRNERPEAAEGPALVVVQHDRRVDISLLLERSLVLAHSVTLHEESAAQDESRILAELTRSLIPLNALLGDRGVGRAWVAGVSKTLETAIGERFRCAVVALDLKSVPGLAFDAGAPDGVHFAGTAGALLAAAGGTVEAFDFLAPRRPPVKQDNTRRNRIAIASAVAALAVIGFVSIKMKEYRLDGEIESLQSREAEINRLLKDHDPLLKSHATVREWEQRKVDWLEQFAKVTEDLPPRDRAYLTEFQGTVQASKGSIAQMQATGQAKERQDADDLKANLARDYRLIPNAVVQGKDSAYPFQTKIELELLPPEPMKPAAGGSQTAPSAKAR